MVLGLALYVGQSQITMRYEASMTSLLQESSKALLHLTEVFQKVGYVHNGLRTRVSDPYPDSVRSVDPDPRGQK